MIRLYFNFNILSAGFVLFGACPAWAIELSQAPPASTGSYVAPNVIISVDDSGSMVAQTGGPYRGMDIKSPRADGTWDPRAMRINVLKHALGEVFSDSALIPDRKIRLAWQAMWNNGGSPGANTVNHTVMQRNSMRYLDGAHRKNFLGFISSLTPDRTTPSHLMFSQADSYMRRPLGDNSPWAAEPGTKGPPYLGCRPNYHIMMTDGLWNGAALSVPDISRRDNSTNLVLSDRNIFGGITDAERRKTALYRDSHSVTTLADWAFYSWATPLQTSGLVGAPKPKPEYLNAPPTESFGISAGREVVLEKYWNPRYNPATWPHMVTYTIGFSADAVSWPGAPYIRKPSQTVPFGYDNGFLDLASGSISWPDMAWSDSVRALDLWHAALNGRGRFYAVTKGEDLQRAFREIIEEIRAKSEPDLSSSATSGYNVSRNPVAVFTAGYEPQNNWKGFIFAEKVLPDGRVVPGEGWSGKNTADKLDDASFNVERRLILTWNDKWATTEYRGGSPFRWSSDETFLSTGQKLTLQRNASGLDEGPVRGQQRLNYVRGDRLLEADPARNANALRERKSRQGGIINAETWYTGAPSLNYALKGYDEFVRINKDRSPMIYVGGNDGMLHGFSAVDGSERIAYVPRGVIPSLSHYSSPLFNSNHRYTVDGSPMTGDVDLGLGVQDPQESGYSKDYRPDWRTLLVGTLGAGGKGYFVLDVTNPSASDSSTGVPGFAEANAAKLVRLDRTRGSSEAEPVCTAAGLSSLESAACSLAAVEDADIGHITARPVRDEINPLRASQITRLNNNRWAVVLGNGYNSKNQRPVLLVQYLDRGQELLRIPATTHSPGTGNATDNGLAAPRLVDINGDQRPDVAYAGDNLGNLWKFDLTHSDASRWTVALNGAPLFSATGPASSSGTGRTLPQPISAAPMVRANNQTRKVGSGKAISEVPVSGLMVAFGTGRNVSNGDAENVDVQSLYSVLDHTRYKTVETGIGKRLAVHPGAGSCPSGPDCVPAPQPLGSGISNARLSRVVVNNTSAEGFSRVDQVGAIDWNLHNGWYLDLPVSGERLLKNLEPYEASSLLLAWTQVPARSTVVGGESCDASPMDGERQYRTIINIVDGGKPRYQLVDANGDGAYDMAADFAASRAQVGRGAQNLIAKGDRVVNLDARRNSSTLARLPEVATRPVWRHLR